jgi:hypothetical protein
MTTMTEPVFFGFIGSYGRIESIYKSAMMDWSESKIFGARMNQIGQSNESNESNKFKVEDATSRLGTFNVQAI